jgi:prevent-host-death family protein
MKTVGIRELKTNLSSYINETRSGATIVITDRGEEVAVICPLSNEYKLMAALEKSGRARWSKAKPIGLEEGIAVKGEPLSVTILEERE